jgi:glycerol-3-phosphate acyltransferase PlsY
MPLVESSLGVIGLWALIGYLLGSIPFGVLITRSLGLGNLREIGSGNIGATNVLRTGNKKAAAATLVLDGGKGALAVLLARAFVSEDAVQIAALAAFVGHCFPIWLGFRGGKGVATFLGILLALWWPLGLTACATWLLVAAVFRYSSLAALVAAGLAPVWAILMGYGVASLLCVALALLIYLRHSANIARLRAGTESRIGSKG